MAYHGRTLLTAPPPPPLPSSSSLSSKNNLILSTDHHYNDQNDIKKLSLNNNINNINSIRSLSITNISRLSNSNKSTDSVTSRSSSISSNHTNIDNDSITTTPKSLSPTIISSRLLDEYEINKIEMFYRSHRTFVYVGQSLITLFITETELIDNGRQSRPNSNNWKQICVGVPVLLFNRGDTRSRDKRQIQICIAEYRTGFKLWSDIIDNLSNYKPFKSTFHTMYLSVDHRKMAGFQFENQFAALEFYRQIEIITANPLNISLTGPKSMKKSDEKFRIFRKQRSKSVGRTKDSYNNNNNNNNNNRLSQINQSPFYDLNDFNSFQQFNNNKNNRRQPNKMEISAPCLFQHITSVNLNNFNEFDSTTTNNNEQQLKQERSDYSTPFPYQQHQNEYKITSSSTSA